MQINFLIHVDESLNCCYKARYYPCNPVEDSLLGSLLVLCPRSVSDLASPTGEGEGGELGSRALNEGSLSWRRACPG